MQEATIRNKGCGSFALPIPSSSRRKFLYKWGRWEISLGRGWVPTSFRREHEPVYPLPRIRQFFLFGRSERIARDRRLRIDKWSLLAQARYLQECPWVEWALVARPTGLPER